jgi:hypothetical protein
MSNENAPDLVAGLLSGRGTTTVPQINVKPVSEPATTEIPPPENVFNLTDELRARGYHPVMLFGTRSSGKTTLLASLFAFANTDVNSPGSVSLGDPIIPLETEEGVQIDNHVQRIFNEYVLNFADGKPAPRTEKGIRIFMPIVFTPNRRSNGIKIAFLESSGEDYMVHESTETYFPKLENTISDMYRNYPGPISIIIAAPYLLESIHSASTLDIEEQKKEERDSDRGLYAALQNYQQFRNPKFRKQDRFLFVLTKWDEHTKSVTDKNFLNPTPGTIIGIISEKFEKSWIFFQKIKNVRTKNVLVYSAGFMTGEVRLKTPDRFQPTLSIFPRKLWTWIIRGAKNDRYDQFIETSQKYGAPIIAFFRKMFF